MAIIQRLKGVSQAVEPERLDSEYGQLLGVGEAFEIGFRVFRDMFVFTDRRLVLINVQGVRGKETRIRLDPVQQDHEIQHRECRLV